MPLLDGLVVAAYGRRYGVELDNGSVISCVTRGKKNNLACGDRVQVKLTATNEGVVENLRPRTSLLYRSNAYRSKVLAANVTQIIIVLATVPGFYEALFNRCLVAAEAAGIRALIVLNKCDLADPTATLALLQPYADLGYPILPLSAIDDISPLKKWLQGNASVLVGQSGMGKSTIVNALLPSLSIRTREISTALDSGKHTTTAAHLYHLDKNNHLIDSPGLQEFGLNHLSIGELEQAFIEFHPFLGKCRFQNCRHNREPDCALSQAVADDKISGKRLAYFQDILRENANHNLIRDI